MRFLHDTVAKEGYRVVMLHGQRSQVEREEAMKAFRSGKSQVRHSACSWAGEGKSDMTGEAALL